MNALAWGDILYYGFYAILMLIVVYGVFLSVQAFRARITWGQARYMGIPFALFIWIQFVFYLVLFEGTFAVISFLLNLPLWIDFSIVALTLVVVSFIYRKLAARAKFNKRLFLSLVLVPLGIPGSNLVADLAHLGAVEIAQVGAVSFVKKGDLHILSDSIDSAANDIVAIASNQSTEIRSISRRTIIGMIDFTNTHTIGRVGDYLTARRLTGMGYIKISSKHSRIHGIDGVYVKYANPTQSQIERIIVVENKVGTARLSPNQMSDNWLQNAITKLLESSDLTSRTTGELLVRTLEHDPKILSKQLWHHDLLSGHTIVHNLDVDGKIQSIESTWGDKLIENTLRQLCHLPEFSTCRIQ